jgi:hypothetical protein
MRTTTARSQCRTSCASSTCTGGRGGVESPVVGRLSCVAGRGRLGHRSGMCGWAVAGRRAVGRQVRSAMAGFVSARAHTAPQRVGTCHVYTPFAFFVTCVQCVACCLISKGNDSVGFASIECSLYACRCWHCTLYVYAFLAGAKWLSAACLISTSGCTAV